MSQLSPSEITKVRKAALQSVTLSSDMKSIVIDAKLKELTQDIKKILIKKDAVLEVVCIKINS
jgi:hypothetical protein